MIFILVKIKWFAHVVVWGYSKFTELRDGSTELNYALPLVVASLPEKRMGTVHLLD